MNRLKNILQITSTVLVMVVFFSSCEEKEDPKLAVPKSVAIPAADITSSGFTITWKKVTGATEYYLDVATDKGFTKNDKGGVKDKKMGDVETYTFATGLSPSTEYHVRIRAGKGSIKSGYSLVRRFTTKKTPLAKPTNVAIPNDNIASSAFLVTWTKVTDAAEYYLDVSKAADFRDKSGGGLTDEKIDDGNAQSRLVVGLTAATKYYVRLRASKADKAQISDYSTSVYATTSAAPSGTKLEKPVGLAVKTNTLKKNEATVSWTVVPNATKYFVDVSKSATFAPLVGNIVEVNTNEISLTALEPFTTYHVRVRAQKGDDAATLSMNSTAFTFKTKFAEPVVTLGEKSSSGFKVSWTAITGADKYFIDVSADVGFSSPLAKTNIEATGPTSHTFDDLKPATRYWVTVRAQKGTDEVTRSDNSIVEDITTTASSAPVAPPVNPQVTAVNTKKNEFKLTWTAVAVDSYEVEVATDALFASKVGGTRAVASGTTAEYEVTGLKSGTKYYVRIRSVKSGDKSTDVPVAGGVTTKGVVAPDARIKGGTLAATSFTVEWDLITGASYKVYVSKDQTFADAGEAHDGHNPKAVAEGTNELEVTGLAPDTQYYVKVLGTTAADGDSDATVLPHADTKTLVAPAPPQRPAGLTTGYRGATSLAVEWTASTTADVESQHVTVAEGGTANLSDPTKIVDKARLPAERVDYDVTVDLEPNTLYGVRVCAVKGGVEACTEYEETTLNQLVAPTGLALKRDGTNTATSVEVSWTPSTSTGDDAPLTQYITVSTDRDFSEGSFVAIPGGDTYEEHDITGGIGTNEFTILGLTAGTPYYVQVCAFRDDGWSACTEVFSFTTVAGK